MSHQVLKALPQETSVTWLTERHKLTPSCRNLNTVKSKQVCDILSPMSWNFTICWDYKVMTQCDLVEKYRCIPEIGCVSLYEDEMNILCCMNGQYYVQMFFFKL
jgi:hypothetical protein